MGNQSKAAEKTLLPCPFCGQQPDGVTRNIKEEMSFVECTRCDYEGPHREFNAQAVGAWNTRWTPPGNDEDVCANCGKVYRDHLLWDGNKCHLGSINGWFPRQIAIALTNASPDLPPETKTSDTQKGE